MITDTFLLIDHKTVVQTGTIIHVNMDGYIGNGFYQVTEVFDGRFGYSVKVTPISNIDQPDDSYSMSDLDDMVNNHGKAVTIYNT